MLSKSNNYIINLSDQILPKQDLVGNEAIWHAELLRNEIPLPDTFVLTAMGFDDFLTAGNVIEEILDCLERIDGTYDNAVQISREITDIVNKTTVPSIIMNPVLHAYRNLSGFTDKFVTVRPSWILDTELVPQDSSKGEYVRKNIKGDGSLLHAIKQSWLALFSPEAIMLRYQHHYQGELSIAVLVQVNVQAEITGEALMPSSHHGYDDVENLLEVSAILGIKHDKEPEIMPDLYIVDADKNLILEKVISSQDHMYIRKSRGPEQKEMLVKIDISLEWQRKQKLSDKFILDLGLIAKHSMNLLDSGVKISWSYDAGKIIVNSIDEMADYSLAGDSLQIHADSMLRVNQEMEILPAEILEPTAEESVKKEPESDNDFKKLIDEVELLTQELGLQGEFEEAEAVTDVENMIPKLNLNLADYNLHTKLIYDMSKLSSGSLAKAQQLNGGFFDATDMLLRHRVLPESIYENKSKLKQIVEDYAHEIATAAKAVEQGTLFYEFSDLTDQKYMSLTGSVNNDHVDGAERFVMNPNALFTEILAIKKAKHTHEARNISLIMPKLRSEPEMTNIKKLLVSEGIKRVSSLELWAEVATPAFLHEIEHLNIRDVDGLVIDIVELIASMVGRRQIIERDIDTVFKAVSRAVENTGFKLMIKLPMQELMLQKLSEYKLHPWAIIIHEFPDSAFLRELEAWDKQKLEIIDSSKRIGRPQKPLFVRK